MSECVSEQMKLSEQHSGTGCYLLLHALSFDLCELLEELALSGLNSVFVDRETEIK